MDSLPKRRKKRDNPYTLLYESDTNKYYILFKNNKLNDVQDMICRRDIFARD